jgi:hypothetical protein
MFKDIIRAIIRRSLLIFALLQVGFILAIYVIVQLAHDANIYGSTNWYLLISAFSLLALAFVLSLFFVLSPAYSLVEKINELLRWRDWLLNEFPKFLVMLPTIVKSIRDTWDGLKPKSDHPNPVTAQSTATKPDASTD